MVRDFQQSNDIGADNLLRSPDDIVIAVMGVTGVGKSTFINYFSDRPVPVGNDLESCKSSVIVEETAKSHHK